MTSAATEQVPSPKSIKKFEKELAKEEKMEASRVKGILGDLAKTEKTHAKVEKAIHKADNALAKAEKKEIKAVKAANKAAHEHDIAVAKLHNAEQDEQLQKRHNAKLVQEIEEKKVKADAAVKDQEIHNKAREDKLVELREAHAQSAMDADLARG